MVTVHLVVLILGVFFHNRKWRMHTHFGAPTTRGFLSLPTVRLFLKKKIYDLIYMCLHNVIEFRTTSAVVYSVPLWSKC